MLIYKIYKLFEFVLILTKTLGSKRSFLQGKVKLRGQILNFLFSGESFDLYEGDFLVTLGRFCQYIKIPGQFP